MLHVKPMVCLEIETKYFDSQFSFFFLNTPCDLSEDHMWLQ